MKKNYELIDKAGEDMSKRITLISLITKDSLNKVDNLMKDIEISTCKVPFGIDDENRYKLDNLPYHLTIFATDKDNQEELINLIKTINIEKISLKVNDVKIMNGRNNSYVLYLGIEENKSLKELQRIFYNKFSKEHYNPDNFTFHITLHIDKNYNEICDMQNKIKKIFEPFYIEFNQIGLFDYPGEKICLFKLGWR